MAGELAKKAEELALKKAQTRQTIALLQDYERLVDVEIATNRKEQEQEDRLNLARALQKGGGRHDPATMAKALALALETLTNTVPGDPLQVNGVAPASAAFVGGKEV